MVGVNEGEAFVPQSMVRRAFERSTAFETHLSYIEPFQRLFLESIRSSLLILGKAQETWKGDLKSNRGPFQQERETLRPWNTIAWPSAVEAEKAVPRSSLVCHNSLRLFPAQMP